MQTLLEILEKTTTYLKEKGLKNPRLEAQVLLSEVLGCKRLDLYLQYERPMEEAILIQLREFVRRRGKREPWQYIVGSVVVEELSLKVDGRALIPRPETEELFTTMVTYLERKKHSPKCILDLGTGSGVLAFLFARHCPQAKVVAVEKSVEALDLARENAVLCGLQERVEFVRSDWFNALRGKFDLIVSNPPYLSREEWEEVEPEVRYEPMEALVAEEAGSSDLVHILREARSWLEGGGTLAMEMGEAHHAILEPLALELGYQSAISLKDVRGCRRFFLAECTDPSFELKGQKNLH